MDRAMYTFVLSLVLCLSYVNSKKIPSYIELCHRDDPKLEDCLRRAVEVIRPHLLNGIPELHIPSLNPLLLPYAGLESGDNFKASFKNIEVYHAEEFVLEHLKVDLSKLHVEITISLPRITLQSHYNIDGKLLIVQLNGEGPSVANLTNVRATLVSDGNFITKNGQKYIDINGNTTLNLDLGKPVFYFGNIFKNNSELNDRTNKIINENVVDIIDELRPVIDKSVTQIVFGIIGGVFDRFSFDELFPK